VAKVDVDRVNFKQLTDKASIVYLQGLPAASPQTVHAMVSIQLQIDKQEPEIVEIPVTYDILPRFSAYPDVINLPPPGAVNAFSRITIVSNGGSKVQIDKITPCGIVGMTFRVKQSASDTAYIIANGTPTLEDVANDKTQIDVSVHGESSPIVVAVK